MTDVVKTIADINFNVLGANQLLFEINDANEASIRIALALGATIDHEFIDSPPPDSMRSSRNLALVVNKQ